MEGKRVGRVTRGKGYEREGLGIERRLQVTKSQLKPCCSGRSRLQFKPLPLLKFFFSCNQGAGAKLMVKRYPYRHQK